MLEAISTATFAFGALTFSALALFYWGERRRGTGGRRNGVLLAFTVVCAIAFLDNVVSWEDPGGWLSAGLSAIRGLAIGLLPPLIFHVVLDSRGRPATRPWRRVLVVFYILNLTITIAMVLQRIGRLPFEWVEYLYRAPAAMLATASALGLVFQLPSLPSLPAAAHRHRRWIVALMALMLVCASASLIGAGAYLEPVPDYLLLALFGVSLYYRDPLVFFDVLMKRGAYVALGLVALTTALLCLPALAAPWIFGFMLVWLAAPWIYGRVARMIDRIWLRRPYSVVEAEREFMTTVQGAANEEELRSRAVSTLSAIFQTPAEVAFRGAVDLPARLEADCLHVDVGQTGGFIRLPARANGVPFLSDDRRLLRWISTTLAMALENVRFRAERQRQQEREQQLRLLASRAELKALRAQINPHFLFNALSVIAGLMQYQPELADETIGHLAQVFRYTLRGSESEWTTLGEEIEFITAYLRIEQARFGDRLQLDLDVDPAAARIPIPAMSIQPLVENAIRHGVSASEGFGSVGLRATFDDGVLSVEVSDNGPGFPPDFSLQSSPGESHGLRNVSERLSGYYGGDARLSWSNGAGRTRVLLTLPAQCAVSAAGGRR